MNIKLLIGSLQTYNATLLPHEDIKGISYDSRQVAPGNIFVAIKGTHVDGHHYIENALERGASAIVGENLPDNLLGKDVPFIRVPDSRKALAYLACQFYGNPAKKLGVIGVTGTDGKTTTTNLISALLDAADLPNGLMSTVNFKIGNQEWANSTRQSTLESLEIQEMLQKMADEGMRYAVIETTSHALELDRVLGCQYDVAVVTNITHEHLDFHHTVEQYRRAKAKLFTMVNPVEEKGLKVKKATILNADDSSYSFLLNFCHIMPLTYGIENKADIRAVDLKMDGNSTSFRALFPDGDILIETQLVGKFNVYNCLAALAVGYSQKLSPEIMKKGLAEVTGISGRMEQISSGQDFSVIVDYAHTPDSLSKVLNILRPLTPGRLIVVFGSAGERDTQKRPIMGEAAANLSDFFVITDEDPREEDRETILEEIAQGAIKAGKEKGKDFLCIADRRDAITAAFNYAKEGDTVLLAGKGHEQCIIMGRDKVPWDDRTVAREVLSSIKQTAV